MERRNFLKLLGIGGAATLVNPLEFLDPVNRVYSFAKPRTGIWLPPDALKAINVYVSDFGTTRLVRANHAGTWDVTEDQLRQTIRKVWENGDIIPQTMLVAPELHDAMFKDRQVLNLDRPQQRRFYHGGGPHHRLDQALGDLS